MGRDVRIVMAGLRCKLMALTPWVFEGPTPCFLALAGHAACPHFVVQQASGASKVSTTASKSLHIFAVSHKPNTMQGHKVDDKKGRKRYQRPKSREETPKEGLRYA
jgi:hypothetical protein